MAWTQKKGQTVFAVAGAFIAVLVVWGVVVFVTGGDGDEAGPDDSTSGSPSGPSGTEPVDGTVPSGDLGELTPDPSEGNRFRFESPSELVWYPVLDGVPAEFTETRSKGFPRNEEGAALAAWHIFNRASGLYPDSYDATIDEQVTGEGAQLMKQLLTDLLADIENPETNSLQYGPVGYDITFFNPLNAEIKVYAITIDEPVETRNDNKLAIPIELVWENNDWKMVAPEDGFNFGAEDTALDPQFSFGGNWK